MSYQVIIHPTPETSLACAVFTSKDDAALFIECCKKYERENHVNWQYSIQKLPDLLSLDNCTIDDPLTITTAKIFDTSTIVSFIRSMNEAHLFLQAKFAFNDAHNIHHSYYIFYGNQLLEQHDRTPNTDQNSEKEKVFRPTPLPRKLRLGPGGYWVDPEEDDK